MTMQPGVTMQPPPLARGPYAPPPFPPAEPRLRQYVRRKVELIISAQSTLVLGIFSVVFFWLPPIGVLFGLGVVITHHFQLRLIDYYAAHFEPGGFPDRGFLQTGFVLGFVGLGLSALASVGWVLMIVASA